MYVEMIDGKLQKPPAGYINRTSLIELIASKLGYDIDLLETYETSKLKQIWDNIKTVNVEASIEDQTDKNITKYLLIGGCFLLVGIYLLKKL